MVDCASYFRLETLMEKDGCGGATSPLRPSGEKMPAGR